MFRFQYSSAFPSRLRAPSLSCLSRLPVGTLLFRRPFLKQRIATCRQERDMNGSIIGPMGVRTPDKKEDHTALISNPPVAILIVTDTLLSTLTTPFRTSFPPGTYPSICPRSINHRRHLPPCVTFQPSKISPSAPSSPPAAASATRSTQLRATRTHAAAAPATPR